MGYLFKSYLPTTSNAHFNLRDVTAFSAHCYHSNKSSSRISFYVTTDTNSYHFPVKMNCYSGESVQNWMSVYLRASKLQNAQKHHATKPSNEKDIHVETELHSE